MKKIFSILALSALLLNACIKDDFVEDFVEPTIRITNGLQSLALGKDYTFDYTFLNNTGKSEVVAIQWMSSDPLIVTINEDSGFAVAADTGIVMIHVSYQNGDISVADSIEVAVTDETIIIDPPADRGGTVNTTSSYALSGDFTLTENTDGSLELTFDENYNASTALPGLYVYLSNNPNTVANALEIAKVTTFSGAHSYTIPNVGIMEYSHVLYYCKPFNVKVGDGEIE